MAINNLSEDFLYEKLPAGLIELDERGLIQAVVGGYQQRVEDLRSYAKKLQDFYDPTAFPETGNNAVLVDLESAQGKAYTRSLDITLETPPDGTTALTRWAAQQLNLDVGGIFNVRYGQDLLRQVDTRILDYLGATIGAVLYESDLLADDAEQQAANVQLVQTYFPRLKIKGTPSSFEVLGRILGFDDVKFTPLWSRVVPHMPEDIGDPANDPDFQETPDYYPRQEVGIFYNPLETDDGPFHTWYGTVSNNITQTDFYTTAINGFSPYITVTLLGSLAGTNAASLTDGTIATHPATGSYALAGGGAYTRAAVEPDQSSFRFTAVTEGDSYNGVYVHVEPGTSGTNRILSVRDRLSSVKYRSSYFDLGLTMDMDEIEERFGSSAAKRNTDLAEGLVTEDGPAVSPFRPWVAGSIAHGTLVQDYLVSLSGSGTQVFEARVQASTTDRQLNFDKFQTTGIQVAKAFEEVRPATRRTRRTGIGFLITDVVPYACYDSQDLIVQTTTFPVSGSYADSPLPDYVASLTTQFKGLEQLTWPSTVGKVYVVQTRAMVGDSWTSFGTLTADEETEQFLASPVFAPTPEYQILDVAAGTVVSAGSSFGTLTVNPTCGLDPVLADVRYFNYQSEITNLDFDGTYNFNSGIYSFDATPWAGTSVVACIWANWTPTSTEVIRPEPTAEEKYSGTIACLQRPEDDEDICLVINGSGTFEACLLGEVVDDYPWRRDVVNGGQLVEFDDYLPLPATPDIAIDALSEDSAFLSHEGVDMSVFVINSTSGRQRLTSEYRSYARGEYQPGHVPVGYRGTFRDVASYTSTMRNLINGISELDTVFSGTYSIYPVGVVQGVVVADPVKFNGNQHRQDLSCWMPMNEHVDDDLVVNDRSAYAAAPYLSPGISSDQRVWDADRGWTLRLDDGDAMQSDVFRGVEDDLTLSFWIRQEGALATGTATILEYGPLSFDLDNAGTDIQAYVRLDTGSRQLVGTISVADWRFVYMRLSGINVYFGYGTLSAANVEITDTQTFAVPTEDDILQVRCGSRTYRMSDLRIWSRLKTEAEMNLVRYHNPTTTVATYPLGFIWTANRQDRYGMEVLPNGLVAPGLLPAWYRRKKMGLVRRYDSMAHYQGEDRFKEVGLGGGRSLPPLWQLGSQFANLEAYGTTVVSTQHGLMPGVNQYWLNDTSAGTYVIVGTNGVGTLAPAPIVSDVSIIYNDTFSQPAGPLLTPPWVLYPATVLLPAYSGAGTAGTGGGTPSGVLLASTTALDGFVEIEFISVTSSGIAITYRHNGTSTYYALIVGSGAWSFDRYISGVPTTLASGAVTTSANDVFRVQFTGNQHQFFRNGGQFASHIDASGSAIIAAGLVGFRNATLNGFSMDNFVLGLAITTWPVAMEQTNPCREFIWVEGDDSAGNLPGPIYKVFLDGTFDQTSWVAEQVNRTRSQSEINVNPIYGPLRENGTYYEATVTGYISGTLVNGDGTISIDTGAGPVMTVVDFDQLLVSEQPTGAEVILAGSGFELGVNTAGSVYQRPLSGTYATPPVYLYVTSRIVADANEGTDAGSILQAWTENGATAADFDVDTSDLPSVVDSNDVLRVPARGDNGVLEFENTGSLLAGRYRLEVASGNIGRLDGNFDGFDVEITVDTTVLEKRLLTDATGYNVRGIDTFEFDVGEGVIGTWLLSFDWTNSFVDETRDVRRQLTLYSYELRRLESELFRVDIDGSATFPLVTPMTVLPWQGTTPGGWLFAINSYGTVTTQTHESQVYTGNDTVDNNLPLSGIYTGVTPQRREDILVTTVAIVDGTGTNYATDFVLLDLPGIEFPSFGSAVVIS